MSDLGFIFDGASYLEASYYSAPADPTEAFRAAMLEKLGYAPRRIDGDSRVHRFATSKSGRGDNGWYRLHDDDFPAGSFGDWRTGEKFTWRAREVHEMSPDDRRRLEEVKSAREKADEIERVNAVVAAKARWENAALAVGDHPYLRYKNTGPHGIRLEHGRLLVPVLLAGELVSVQAIDANGGKMFAKGTRVEDGSYAVGELGDKFVIAEGFATCATIHEATGFSVIAAFTAGNILPVAKLMRERFPDATITIAADDDFKTEMERGFNPGLLAANKAAEAVGAIVAAPLFDRANDGDAPSDWNDFAASYGNDAVKDAFQAAHASVHAGAVDTDRIAAVLGSLRQSNGSMPNAKVAEAPRPLFRELAAATPYPVDALGSILALAASAIVDRVQCPDALATQSVLAAASLAVQAHADVEIPATGHVKPISLFMVSVAASGERKSAADGEALWPVRKREKALREAYAADVPEYLKLKAAWDAARKKALDGTKGDKHAIKTKLDEVGDEPPKPLEPMLTCGEPTFEGLCKILAAGQPAMGLFSDEGGSFIGGHGMSPDAKLRTIAGLSGIWDGSPIKRVRALDGSSIIAGKRVALHLMAQPEAAALMLTDPVLLDQGFLSRVLVSAPASTAGTRFQREPDPASGAALSRYQARILSILERQPTLALDSRNELDPRVLCFAPDAANAWREYADHVERLLGPGQPFEPIRGFANKLPEHAARIAAVLMLVDDIGAQHIDRETFERAIRTR